MWYVRVLCLFKAWHLCRSFSPAGVNDGRAPACPPCSRCSAPAPPPLPFTPLENSPAPTGKSLGEAAGSLPRPRLPALRSRGRRGHAAAPSPSPGAPPGSPHPGVAMKPKAAPARGGGGGGGGSAFWPRPPPAGAAHGAAPAPPRTAPPAAAAPGPGPAGSAASAGTGTGGCWPGGRCGRRHLPEVPLPAPRGGVSLSGALSPARRGGPGGKAQVAAPGVARGSPGAGLSPALPGMRRRPPGMPQGKVGPVPPLSWTQGRNLWGWEGHKAGTARMDE